MSTLVRKDGSVVGKLFFVFNTDSCEMRDIAVLRDLLSNNGFAVEEQKESSPGEMGTDFSFLAVILPILPNVIEEIASIIKMWISNRRIKFKLEDKEKGRLVEIDSFSGKTPSQAELKDVLSVFFSTDNQDQSENTES